MKKPLNLCVVGASGRSGSLVVSLVPEYPGIRLLSALVSTSSKMLGLVALEASNNHGQEVRYSSDIAAGCREADFVIDFSTRSSSIEVIKRAAERKIPCLVATTGHDLEEQKLIEECATRTAILLAPNTSVGIEVLRSVALLAKKMLGQEFDVEILDVHHALKRDAPSGTALSLARSIAEAEDLTVVERNGVHQMRKSGELGVSALRVGDVPGEHTIIMAGKGERVELIHRARDRSVFARGALTLGPKLITMAPGLYSVSDVLARY